MTQNISHAQWDLIEEDLKEIMLSSNTFKQVKENILEWFKPDMNSGSLNHQIKGIINRIIIDKYTVIVSKFTIVSLLLIIKKIV